MYDEQLLIDRIKTITNYNVQLATERTSALLNEDITIPKVYVGHVEVRLQFPEHIYTNAYQRVTEQYQILVTHLLIVCNRANFVEVRTNVYKSYQHFSPFVENTDFSDLFFLGGEVIDRSETKIIYNENVGMAFPQLS